VPLSAGGQSDVLLYRAAELAKTQGVKMLVVSVIDTRSGFEPDGPAAMLPEEAAARRSPDVRKRLNLQLARNNLAWVEAMVLWGEPKTVLADVIRRWKPDLVVTFAEYMSHEVMDGVDALTVRRPGVFRRMAEVFFHPPPRHA
jgi:hypothetical protein